MDCDFAEIVVVPFPFVDGLQVKRRPALVLSNRVFNRKNGHTALAMVTTGAGSHWPSDIVIENLEGTGLDHASLIRWKVFTLPNELILRKLGSLSQITAEMVSTALRNTFGHS